MTKLGTEVTSSDGGRASVKVGLLGEGAPLGWYSGWLFWSPSLDFLCFFFSGLRWTLRVGAFVELGFCFEPGWVLPGAVTVGWVPVGLGWVAVGVGPLGPEGPVVPGTVGVGVVGVVPVPGSVTVGTVTVGVLTVGTVTVGTVTAPPESVTVSADAGRVR